MTDERELELLGRIRLYRDLLEQHGIALPDHQDAAEMERASRRMVAAACELMVAAHELQARYGTSMELVRPWTRRETTV